MSCYEQRPREKKLRRDGERWMVSKNKILTEQEKSVLMRKEKQNRKINE